MRFFRGHGFGFNNFLCAVLVDNLCNDFIGFLCIFCPVNNNTAFFSFFFEFEVQFFHVLAGIVFGVSNLLDDGFTVNFTEHCFTAGTIINSKFIKGASQELVVERFVDILFIIFCGFNTIFHAVLLLSFEQNNVHFKWAVYADSSYAFNIRGTAWA